MSGTEPDRTKSLPPIFIDGKKRLPVAITITETWERDMAKVVGGKSIDVFIEHVGKNDDALTAEMSKIVKADSIQFRGETYGLVKLQVFPKNATAMVIQLQLAWLPDNMDV